jgi:hypothetical protein
MLRIAYTNLQWLVTKMKDGEIDSKKLLVVVHPEWDISQLFKQIQLAIFSAQVIKRDYLFDCVTPVSLQSTFNKTSTFQEADLYEISARAFFSYLVENEQQIKTDNQWAQKMVNTVILINDNVVNIATADSELFKEIKDKLKNEKNCVVKEGDRLSLLFAE